MYHQWAADRIVVVGSEVGMVPIKSIFVTHGEFVSEVAPSRDGILLFVRQRVLGLSVPKVADLCYSRDSIHIRGSTLKKAWYEAFSIPFLTNEWAFDKTTLSYDSTSGYLPCQWIVFSTGKSFFTNTSRSSPSLTSINGPGC